MCQEIDGASWIQIKIIDKVVLIFELNKRLWIRPPRLYVIAHWEIELKH
jgi:hypothetical protein